MIELMMTVSIIGIMAMIAIPNYSHYRESIKISVSISEIKQIERNISNFLLNNGALPDSLDDIGKAQFIDPWGNPYQYLRLDGGTAKDLKGKRRRDKNANPVNSDYDLYSMGPDGKTSAQFTAKNARDDIVRANDGAYYGIAEQH